MASGQRCGPACAARASRLSGGADVGPGAEQRRRLILKERLNSALSPEIPMNYSVEPGIVWVGPGQCGYVQLAKRQLPDPGAWHGSWHGETDNSSAASAIGAIPCVIGAARADSARDRSYGKDRRFLPV